MKFSDVVLLVLFMMGCFVGSIWAKTYLIPTSFPSLVVGVFVVPGASANVNNNLPVAPSSQAQRAINSEAKEAAHA